MLGLSIANVLGVPAAAWLGETFGWRSAFIVVVVVGFATVAALSTNLPSLQDMHATNPMTELGALRRSQVWFTLFIGIVGFGGMFAFYSYLNSTLTSLSGASVSVVPWALMLYGLGMVVGNIVGGIAADRNVTRAIFCGLLGAAAALATFSLVAANVWAALALTFLVAFASTTMLPALQTRLMDVAEDAQTLAAALNHSALNVANALGAWLGGVVIAAGYGYRAPSMVGAVLALGGVLVAALVAGRRKAAR